MDFPAFAYRPAFNAGVEIPVAGESGEYRFDSLPCFNGLALLID